MESAPYRLAFISLGSCPSDGERSLSALHVLALEVALQMGSTPHPPTAFKQPAPQMGSAPYLNRPVTGFHHLRISAPYLPPPGLELDENSAFS
jgi:hypothetical protein